MPSAPSSSALRNLGKRVLKRAMTSIGVTPADVRAQLGRRKDALQDRARELILPPERLVEFLRQAQGNFAEINAQLEVLRQQDAAARARIAELEAVHAQALELVEETAARLKMLDVNQREVLASLQRVLASAKPKASRR